MIYFGAHNRARNTSQYNGTKDERKTEKGWREIREIQKYQNRVCSCFRLFSSTNVCALQRLLQFTSVIEKFEKQKIVK